MESEQSEGLGSPRAGNVGIGNARDFYSVGARAAASRFLTGHGVELGPGRDPFPMGHWVDSVVLVEKDLHDEYSSAHGFSESARQPRRDEVVNLDLDNGMLKEALGAKDFIVASHVIEHLASPVAFLEECHRTLVVGGSLVLVVPDMRFTFDAPRQPTTLEHLAREYEDAVHEVSREHIVEVLMASGCITDEDELTVEEEERHRLLSVHAHCWTWWTFLSLLAWMDEELLTAWSLVHLDVPDVSDLWTNEFIAVLNKRPVTRRSDLRNEVLAWMDTVRLPDPVKDDCASSLSYANRLGRGLSGECPQHLGLFTSWNVWRRRADLREALPNPIEEPGPMIGWATAMREAEADANLVFRKAFPDSISSLSPSGADENTVGNPCAEHEVIE